MKYLSFLIILFSINSFSADYKSAVRLKEGDVISAEVFNDIMDRIELTLKPITISELVGTWSAKQYICDRGNFADENYCDFLGVIGGKTTENNVFRTRTDTVTISDNGDNTVNLTSPNINIFIGRAFSPNVYLPDTGNLVHTCSFSEAQIVGCLMDSQIDGTSGRVVSFWNIKRTSPTQFVMYISPTEAGGFSISHIILNKQKIAPNPPTNFTATLQSGTTPNVTFSWTASEGGADSYTIKSKDSATGTFADLQTEITNIGSFSDSLTSGTRWYRVFAVDSNGTSIGSNVVSVTK